MKIAVEVLPSCRNGFLGAAVFVNGREVLESWSFSEGGARAWWAAWRRKQKARK